MAIGASSAFALPRRAIHSASLQRYCVKSHTFDALFGRVSAAKPNGSAFSVRKSLYCDVIANLYSAPTPTFGTKPSQTPEAPRQLR
jgi:hypothetical protein